MPMIILRHSLRIDRSEFGRITAQHSVRMFPIGLLHFLALEPESWAHSCTNIVSMGSFTGDIISITQSIHYIRLILISVQIQTELSRPVILSWYIRAKMDSRRILFGLC